MFGDRLRRAPDSIKQAWANKVKDTKKGDPAREELWIAIAI